MKLSELIITYRNEHGLSQRQLAARCNLSTGYISLIEKEINPQTRKRMVPTLGVLNKLSVGMGMTVDELLAVCDDMEVSLSDKPESFSGVGVPANIIPMPEMRRIPLIGTIACGTPITAEQNVEDLVDIPKHIHADFALRCKGDSMINARIFDGDIVYIRQQPTVENGEIAAVLIEDEATLKRFRRLADRIILEPANPLFDSLVYRGSEMEQVHILGKAVAFTSNVR